MSAADSKSKVCEFCRGYNVERQWCHVCGGSGVIAAGVPVAPCACMGPQNGEPLCPCMMRTAGLTTAPIWTPEKKAELMEAMRGIVEREQAETGASQ